MLRQDWQRLRGNRESEAALTSLSQRVEIADLIRAVSYAEGDATVTLSFWVSDSERRYLSIDFETGNISTAMLRNGVWIRH